MKKKMIVIVPLAILGMLLFAFLGGEIVMRLWNWLLPPLFGWHLLGFWQALGLLVLCRILFGGSGWRGKARSGMRQRAAERCEHRTPEEREQLRQRMRERFGFGPSGSGAKSQ